MMSTWSSRFQQEGTPLPSTFRISMGEHGMGHHNPIVFDVFTLYPEMVVLNKGRHISCSFAFNVCTLK
jgi:hypothetical protein